MIFRLSVLVLLSLSLFSCLEDIKETNAPLGVEATATDVQNAVDKATTGITIGTAQVNDCVTYEENYKIEESDTIMTSVMKHKTLSIVDAPDTVTYNLFEDYYTYLNTGVQKDEVHRQMTLPFKKATASSLVESVRLAQNHSNSSKYKLDGDTPITNVAGTDPAADACDGTQKTGADGVTYDCISYFNLSYDDRSIPVPNVVQAKPNCGGFENCQIPGHYLKYDFVKFLNGSVVKKITLQGHFSANIPDLYFIHQSDGSVSYTPAATSLCTTSLEPIGNTKYQVTFCAVLRDVARASAGVGDCYPHTPGT